MRRPEEMAVELRDIIKNISSGDSAPSRDQIENFTKMYDATLSEQQLSSGDDYFQERLYRYNCDNFAFFSSLYLLKEGILRRISSFGNKELSKAIAPLLKNPLQPDKMHLFPVTINHNTFTLYTILTNVTAQVTVLFCAISSSSFFSIDTHEQYANDFSLLFSSPFFKTCDEEALITQIVESGISGKYRSLLYCNCRSITDIFSHYGMAKMLSIHRFIKEKFTEIYPDAAIFEFSVGAFVLFFRDTSERNKSLINYNGVPIPVRYKVSAAELLKDEVDYLDFLTR